MSDIHIGPHTRDDATAPHGAGETHHTFDREINLKAIGKWMLGLLVITIVVEVLSLYFLRGLRSFDEKQDPELTPIQRQVEQKEPSAPRLQVTSGFQGNTPDASVARSDVEDMQILRKAEDEALDNPSWIDQGQGRVRVPIDVAMKVIASRGGAGGGAGTAAPQAPPAQPDEQPAGTAQPPASQEQ